MKINTSPENEINITLRNTNGSAKLIADLMNCEFEIIHKKGDTHKILRF